MPILNILTGLAHNPLSHNPTKHQVFLGLPFAGFSVSVFLRQQHFICVSPQNNKGGISPFYDCVQFQE